MLALVGLLWSVCGVVIGLSPPPSEGRRAALLPFAGWLIAFGGGYALVKAIRGTQGSLGGKAPRHSNGREASRGNALRLLVSTVLAVPMAAFTLWRGIDQRMPSMFCVGGGQPHRWPPVSAH